MKTQTTAKFLNNVSHPIRINIIKLLFAAPKSFSEILKILSFESTSKLSFHLDSLRPLIDKDIDGNYVLTSQGLSIHSLLGSIESNSVIADIIPTFELTSNEENQSKKGSLLLFLKNNLFYFHLCLLFLLSPIYYIFSMFIDQDFVPFQFLTSFLFFIIFILPVFYFIHHFYYCRNTKRSFSYLSMGMLAYIIIYPFCILFFEQTHYLLKSLLNIPEWSLHFEYAQKGYVYSEWLYFSGNLVEIFILYGKIILFSDFNIDLWIIQFYNFPRTILWLICSTFIILSIYFYSKLVKLNWSSSTSPHILFTNKYRILESYKFWGPLFGFYIIISTFYSNLIAIPYPLENTHIFFLSLDYFIPVYIQLFPLLPSLIVTLLIFWFTFQDVEIKSKQKILLVIAITFSPLLYTFLSILEFVYLETLSLTSISLIYLISHLIFALCQFVALTSLTIFQLNLVRIWRDK